MSKKNFYEYLEEEKNIVLNPEQKAAVSFDYGSALVLSTAGSGKTTVIVSRTGRLLYEGLCKNKILTITFSKMAAEDMKARYDRVFKGEFGMKVDFSTIHSFLYKIVLDYFKRTNRTIKIVDNSYKIVEDILKRIYSKEYYSTVNEEEVENIIGKIGYVKNMMISYDKIDSIGGNIKNFKEILLAYDEYKQKNGMMDFDDMLIYGYKLLQKYDYYVEKVKSTYDFIQIDEMQDTSKIQHAIIKLIQNNNLFMVGDDDQSIYSFRGSFPQYMLNFKKIYPEGKVFYLSNNYRSDGHIVSIARHVIENNKERYKKSINPIQNKGSEVRIIKVPNRAVQNKFILDDIKNYGEKTVGVLYRYNISSLMVASMLKDNNIDFYIKDDRTKFFKSPVLYDVIAFLKLSLNPADREAFSRIYYKSYTYFSKKMCTYVLNHPSKDANIFSILKGYSGLEYYMLERIDNFKYDIGTIPTLKPKNIINFIKNDLEYYEYLLKLDEDGRNSLSSTTLILEILNEVAQACATVEEFIAKIDNIKNVLAEAAQNKGARITLSSIHSSKGLEYDIVYLIDNIDKEFPQAQRKESNEEYAVFLEEERRIFYVGLTRAKQQLCVLAPNKPSIFVNEIINK